MLSFISHYENTLVESLDSPVEYFMTDDTKIPGEIYAKFELNGKPYTISLTETNTQGIYMLNMGKLMNKNVMWWKYHSPNDILPALSTLLHFSESSMFFLGTRVKGIIFRLWAPKATMDRMTRVAERVIKRSFVKSFSYVNVSEKDSSPKKDGNALRYVFVVKKGVSPQTLFKSAAFKLYDFSPNSGSTVNPISSEVLDEVKVKKPLKNVVKPEPSRKYTFKGMDVSNDEIGSDEFFEKINSIVEVEYAKPVEDDTKKEMTADEKQAALYVVFSSLFNDLKWKSSFNPEKFQPGSLLKKLQKDVQYLTTKRKALFDKIELEQMSEKEQKEFVKTTMKNVYYNKISYDLVSDYNDMTSYSSSKKTIVKKKSNIDVSALTSNIGVDYQVLGPKESGIGWNVKYGPKGPDASISNAVHYVENDLGYSNKVSSLTNFKDVVKYSGSSYSDYNNPPRSIAGKVYTGKEIPNYLVSDFNNSTEKLASAFKEIDPLPEPMWVYRGTTISASLIDKLNIGDDYVDPGFLSTSLKPNMAFGSDLIMRIYLPKGAKVIPILNHSSHDNEREVLLPSMSVIRLIEIDIADGGSTRYFTGIYIGNAYESFRQKVLDNAMKEAYNDLYRRNLIMTEQNKDKNKDNGKYDKNDKFAGNYDVDLGKKIADDIRNGKIKITK